MKKLLTKIALGLMIAVGFANAALDPLVTAEFANINITDITALLVAVIGFGVALFAFRKARSILKA